jgi:hypothetical protein
MDGRESLSHTLVSDHRLTPQDKLVPITGIAQQHQVLRLFRSSEAAENNEVPVAIMNDDSATLAACGLQEFACVKVGIYELGLL